MSMKRITNLKVSIDATESDLINAVSKKTNLKPSKLNIIRLLKNLLTLGTKMIFFITLL